MTLEQAVADLNQAQTEVEAALRHRDDAIREALKQRGPTEIARITGLTRGRIYQIAEHSR